MFSYDFSNFHNGTFGVWHFVQTPEREPDFVSDSGSAYWDLGHGVVRESDHWLFRIRSCCWLLSGPDGPYSYNEREYVTAYCAYSDFMRNADPEAVRIATEVEMREVLAAHERSLALMRAQAAEREAAFQAYVAARRAAKAAKRAANPSP
jgi:hypothetical protein